jgi:hypothetical protein
MNSLYISCGNNKSAPLNFRIFAMSLWPHPDKNTVREEPL